MPAYYAQKQTAFSPAPLPLRLRAACDAVHERLDTFLLDSINSAGELRDIELTRSQEMPGRPVLFHLEMSTNTCGPDVVRTFQMKTMMRAGWNEIWRDNGASWRERMTGGRPGGRDWAGQRDGREGWRRAGAEGRADGGWCDGYLGPRALI
ncbi:hypothetical protein C8J57DRAFT_1352083 [Mycena rebaudengoi]|nr:hypothetical protein C8J57DRAFT_1352083 [Mycena rebaudengoi]